MTDVSRHLHRARGRLTREIDDLPDPAALLRRAVEEILTCGASHVRLWWRGVGYTVAGEGEARRVCAVACERSSLPTLLQRALSSDVPLRDGDTIAASFGRFSGSSEGGIVFERGGAGPDIEVALEELARVVGVGLRALEAQRSARACEQRYLDLFGRLSLGVTHCRLVFQGDRCVDWIYLVANEAFTRQTGMVDVAGKRLSEVAPGLLDRDPQVLARAERVARTGQSEQFEEYVGTADAWYAVTMYRLAYDEVVIAGEDISARKRAEAELREREQRMRLLVEHAPAGIALFDREMRYVATSRRFLLDYGLEAEDLTGRCHYDVFPELPERIRQIHQRCLAGAVERSNGEPFTRTDGRVDWVRWEVHPWRDARGEIGGIVLFSEILTEQERVARALEWSEVRFRAMFEQAGVGMAQADVRSGRFTAVNDRACAFWGYTRDELLAMRWTEVTHPEELDVDRRSTAPMLSRQVTSLTRDKRYLRKGGATIWGRLTATRLDLPEGTSLLLMIEDISERKRAEAALHESEDQLRVAQKMEVVGRLAGGVAHDFNNLIGVIISYAELASDGLAAGDPARDDLEEIRTAAGRAADLTRQLLAFGRKAVIATEPLALSELIGGMAKMLRRVIEEDIALAIEPTTALWVDVDRVQMEQVIMNLVVNARDAVTSGGHITIRTGEQTLDVEAAAGLGLAPGLWGFLEVADDGCGMSEEVRAHLFEPFFTTKSVGKGTGLGLSTVYGIVQQSGGAIDVKSAPGSGSRFRVYLRPCAEPVARGGPSAPPRRVDGARECLLVVEDDHALRPMLARALGRAGYDVLIAADSDEALAFAEREGARVALILTDVIMPGMNGGELVVRLRPLCPTARVMFMSGYSGETLDRLGAIEAEFLPKPFDPTTLTQRVRAALDATKTKV